MARIKAVVFDVGEIVVNEETEYGTWADYLGVSRHAFSAAFGATIARGLDYRETFQIFRPGFDLATERAARAAAGKPETFTAEDLYPDIVDCLAELRDAGVQVGLAGNQTKRAGEILHSLDLPVDWIRTSDSWGVEKPSAAFFDRTIEETGVPAAHVLYVGDRIDNDITPALQAGMQTVLVKRGPWGLILHDEAIESACFAVLSDLVQLPRLVAEHNRVAAS